MTSAKSAIFLRIHSSAMASARCSRAPSACSPRKKIEILLKAGLVPIACRPDRNGVVFVRFQSAGRSASSSDLVGGGNLH